MSRLSEHANNASLKTNKVTLGFRELLLYILLLLLVLRQLPCRDDLFLLQSFLPHNASLFSGTRGGLIEKLNDRSMRSLLLDLTKNTDTLKLRCSPLKFFC